MCQALSDAGWWTHLDPDSAIVPLLAVILPPVGNAPAAKTCAPMSKPTAVETAAFVLFLLPQPLAVSETAIHTLLAALHTMRQK